MQLSEHFSLAELTRSSTAAAKGIDNAPPATALATAKRLCEAVLEPIRAEWGPMYVTSGYRSPALNDAVDGSPTSDHVWDEYGASVDFQTKAALQSVFDWICQSGLPFDQCFLERGKVIDSEKDDCIHISFRPVSPRRQAGIKPTGGRGKITWVEVT